MKFKHHYLPKPGSLTRTGDEKYLENGTFLRRRVNEVKQVNPETETLGYRVSRIGLYESGLTSLTSLSHRPLKYLEIADFWWVNHESDRALSELTWVNLSTLGLGLPHYVVRGETA